MLDIIDRIFDFWEKEIPVHYNSDVIRPSQVQMSFDIADFLHPSNKSRFLLIEAPVGTGKSLGSLFPALLRLNSNKQIIYATSTINLQGQLIREEVPILKKYRLVKNVILAKGKSHYFCYEQYIKNKNEIDKDLETGVLSFYASTATGHRDDLEKVYKSMPDSEWEKISLVCSKHECSNCKYSISCPTFKHRSKFLSSNNELIITNHNQLIQSCLNQQSYKSYILPPDPGIIIIDEAHDFLDNYLGQVKSSISFQSLKDLGRKIRGKHKVAYRNTVSTLIQIIDENKKSLESLQGRYKIEDGIVTALTKIRGYINEALAAEVSKNSKFRNGVDRNNDDELIDTLETIDNILSSDHVSWVSYEEECLYAINKKFMDGFSRFLKQLSTYNKIILMSGTLTTNNNFDYIIKLWKLDSRFITTKVYETPFNYEKQAVMYVPTGLINATKENNQEYVKNQLKKMKELLNLTFGKSLILTTSKTHMKNIYYGLLESLSKKDINLYIQGSASVESLSEQFKNDVNGVLVGSGSFFSGISVKGESLVSVILTKLPFAVPDDPFFELLSEGYDDTKKFELIYIPNMLIKLKQAVGRLIRDINDYGIISIFDKRVFDKKYGALVRATFEKLGYKITQSFTNVEAFYNNISNKVERFEYPYYSRDKIIISENIKKENEPPKKTFILKEKRLEPISLKSYEKEEKDKQKYYRYFGNLVPISDFTLNTDTCITDEQYNFVSSTLKKYKIRPTKLNSIKDSYELYKYIYDIFYKNLYDLNIITNSFPYINEKQRSIYIKYKGKSNIKYRKSPIKEYILTEEELARLK